MLADIIRPYGGHLGSLGLCTKLNCIFYNFFISYCLFAPYITMNAEKGLALRRGSAVGGGEVGVY